MSPISDMRMDELIQRAKNAATRGVGGGDGSPYREIFIDAVFIATLDRLIANETHKQDDPDPNG